METIALGELVRRAGDLIDRIDLAPDTDVALTDIAASEVWESHCVAGNGGLLAEAFARQALAVVRRRYPAALPFPFGRLDAVAHLQGWWNAADGVPRDDVIAMFEKVFADEESISAAVFGKRDWDVQSALLRGSLEVSFAILRTAQGHPAYN